MVDLTNIPGIEGLISIGKTLGIVAIVYIIFLIARAIASFTYAFKFKKLTKNVEEINQKMDYLTGKKKIKK